MRTASVGLAFFRNGRTNADYETLSGRRYARIRPRITCADGYHLSVQAGEYLYATPRHDAGPWVEVEVGYPSGRPEPWDEWSKYAEEPDRPEGTVYSYVPLTLVEALVAAHGGEA